jgi:hypothetical protein
MRREENQVFDGEFFQTNSNDFAFVLRRKKIYVHDRINRNSFPDDTRYISKRQLRIHSYADKMYSYTTLYYITSLLFILYFIEVMLNLFYIFLNIVKSISFQKYLINNIYYYDVFNINLLITYLLIYKLYPIRYKYIIYHH